MERDEAKRTTIEDKIIAMAHDIQIRKRSDDGIYVELSRLDDFLDTCEVLVDYFKEHEDTTIGVEIIRVHYDFIRYFMDLSANTKDEDTRKEAQLWLAELDIWMDEIIAEAARNWRHLYPNR